MTLVLFSLLWPQQVQSKFLCVTLLYMVSLWLCTLTPSGDHWYYTCYHEGKKCSQRSGHQAVVNPRPEIEQQSHLLFTRESHQFKTLYFCKHKSVQLSCFVHNRPESEKIQIVLTFMLLCSSLQTVSIYSTHLSYQLHFNGECTQLNWRSGTNFKRVAARKKA